MNNAPFIHAVSSDLGDDLPKDIQWMPPGKHPIKATRAGKPFVGEVVVNARTAQTMQRTLEAYRAKADTGAEDRPYIDFNHEDREASGHITAFTWGGEDPKTGGVRAQVEWTEPGKAAIKGRAFRRFSPSFDINAEGEVTTAPLNMGGLVNRAAFKTITAIWSREQSGQATNDEEPTMDPTDKQLAELQAANEKLQREVAEAKNKEAIQAKEAEISTLKEENKRLKTEADEARKVDAKAAVATAVAEGKIPGQDKDTQKHYEELYNANPTATKAILAKLPADPALTTVTPGGQGPVQAKANEHEFVVKARELATKRGLSLPDATTILAGEQPQLYVSYTQGAVQAAKPKN